MQPADRHPRRFRKKPVEIEALQFDGTASGFAAIDTFCEGAVVEIAAHPYIRTLEGDMLVSPEDWVVKGVKGEFYPVKPDIFEQTYEEVADVRRA